MQEETNNNENEADREAYVIGLIGGIASGKSLVASELERLGAAVLDADEAAHAALHRPELVEKLQERWGDGILTPSGEIDRSAVAKVVFESSEKGKQELAFLEQTLHPLIREQFIRKMHQLRGEGAPAIVIDAPLLLEAGWRSLCDDLLFVDCEEQTRLERAIARGWGESEFRGREAAQMPIEEKRDQATAILDNNATPEHVREAVRRYWRARVARDAS